VFFPKKAVLGFEAGQKKSATAMPGAGHCHRQGADRCPERCDRWLPRVGLSTNVAGAAQAVGGLFAMSADAVKFLFRRPFQTREFLRQTWFPTQVSLVPTLMVAIPFTVLVSFTINILLRELGRRIWPVRARLLVR
jgi:hypothetical protein